MGIFAIVLVLLFCAGVAFGIYSDQQKKLQQEKQKEDRERKQKIERDWYKSPEGIAYLKDENREKEKAEKLLKKYERDYEEIKKLEKWKEYHESKTMDEIAAMTGVEFEVYLAKLLDRLDYYDIQLTPNNDQGADIICKSHTGKKIAVQAKRWKSRVGNSAVQELVGAIAYYGCEEGLIITNSDYTRQAIELAGKCHQINLRNGTWLQETIRLCMPSQIPEFDEDFYDKHVKNYVAPSRVTKQRYRSGGGRRRYRMKWY